MASKPDEALKLRKRKASGKIRAPEGSGTPPADGNKRWSLRTRARSKRKAASPTSPTPPARDREASVPPEPKAAPRPTRSSSKGLGPSAKGGDRPRSYWSMVLDRAMLAAPAEEEDLSDPRHSIEVIFDEESDRALVTVDRATEPAARPARAREEPRPPPRRSHPAASQHDYQDLGHIARGGMSSIRAVLDKNLRRSVAMKTFEPTGEVPRRAAERFIEEAQITAQLQHPNIVPVHALGLDAAGNPSFFTMRLVKGRDMDKLLEQLGHDRLQGRNLERLVQITIKACEAIAYAHSIGVVHRDLKPANLMVGSHGQVYVMDWGLALLRAADRDLEYEREHAIGTPAFMAPEQAWPHPERIGEQTDVFGIGGILYAILAGQAPYAGSASVETVLRARAGKVPHPAEVVAHLSLPPELCRIAMKALSPAIEDRYPTIAALQKELEQFLRGGGWLDTREVAAGEVIVHEGDEAHEAYIVVAGECEAFKTVDGKKVTLARMGPGSVFGETVFMTGGRRLASVVALGPCTVKVITRGALEHELAGNSWMKLFIATLAERFCQVSNQVAELLRQRQ